MESEPQELEVHRFVSYLKYKDCEEVTNFPSDLIMLVNTRNGDRAEIPARHHKIQREMMYWVCLTLGINMPEEFKGYQSMMDGAKPAGYIPEK